jgi:hypothetical protein
VTDSYTPSEDSGLRPESPLPDVTGLNFEDAVEAIVDWFSFNYVDPVHYVSYNTREGGYQYVYGPYNASEIINNNFYDDVPENVVEAAIDRIQSEGFDWVPSEDRLSPEEEDDGPSEEELESAPATIHEKMLRQADEAQKLLQSIRDELAGIGHNNPPSPIGDQPLSNKDLNEIDQLIELLKSEPPSTVIKSQEVSKAPSRLRTFALAIGAYIAGKADTFVDAAVKNAGNQFGRDGLPELWQRFGEILGSLADTATAWLHIVLSVF